MGNIGNLNCDHKAHAPTNRSKYKGTVPSRIQEDLARSLRRANHMEDADRRESPMIRRAIGKTPHVCVVGAGVAGLRCAGVLLQYGVRVTILEGRDRVGGRLCQSDVLGHKVDLGPNWIHGTDHNPILDLAKQTKTLTMSWDGRQSVFDRLGRQIPDKEAAEYSEIVWTIIEKAMRYSNEESATIPADQSLYNFFEEQVEKMLGAANDEAKKKRQAILEMAEMWGAFVGSPIRTQSLKFFWLEECIDGENLFVAETYHKILQKIAEPALMADVKFEHKVTKIISREENGDPKVTVELEDKESQTFDEVVMTVPLGWLKRHIGAFEPELPERLRQGIVAIGYGTLDKVYITFDDSFWNKPDASSTISTAITGDPSIPNVTATTAPLHQLSSDAADSESNVNPSHYPGFTHWTNPTYAPDTNPKQWQQEAVNLAALPSSAAHPTLLFYTYGPTSLHIASLLSTSPASQHTQLLTSFFEPYYSRLPNYTPECKPKAILATNWASDELAGYGSYSNFQIGLESGDQDIEAMRKGVPEMGVWIAGEHTSPFVALGTVTGAWWSGEGVARRILGACKLEKDGEDKEMKV